MRAKLLKVFRIFPWFLLAVVGAYLWLDDGWKDITLGREYRLASEADFIHDRITKVIIYRLSGSPDQLSKDFFHDNEVFGTVIVEGDELRDFFSGCWGVEPRFHSGGMCHDPPYGFQLYRDEKSVCETSICWDCANFIVRDHWPFRSTRRGFDPQTAEAKKLLAFCDARLPYYRPPPKPDKTPAASPIAPENRPPLSPVPVPPMTPPVKRKFLSGGIFQ